MYHVLDVQHTAGTATVTYNEGPPVTAPLWQLARVKAFVSGWGPGPWKYKH